MTYKPYDVIVVPFPFTDRNTSKHRPALIISDRGLNEINHSVCAMITTKSHTLWPGDTEITDLAPAGLDYPSIIRLKLFTLDHRLIIKTIGQLSTKDQNSLQKALKEHFPI